MMEVIKWQPQIFRLRGWCKFANLETNKVWKSAFLSVHERNNSGAGNLLI